MNFTSPIKSSGGHNNIFDSPAVGFTSPNIYDCSNEKGVRAINMIHTPFTCGQLSTTRSPPSSQFKTPSKYSDRFIPARTDSVSKTLFDLKDEVMVDEGVSAGKILQESPQQSSSGASGQGNQVNTPGQQQIQQQLQQQSASSSIFSTPSKKTLTPQNENTKIYNEFIQRELFGGSDSILKFHWDQKNYVGSPLSQLQQSPFQLSAKDDRNKEEKRKISKSPFKVLDAPGLQDDFYIDLLDWSSNNEIGVGLGKSIFIWNAGTGSVSRLCEGISSFGEDQENIPGQQGSQASFFTSLKWAPNGVNMAIGNQSGKVELWDVAAQRVVRSFQKQTERIGSIDFNNNNVFAAGSKDKTILIQDIRDPSILRIAHGHKQEVCQVRFSPDQQYLASGGNDNAVLIWNLNRTQTQQGYKLSPFQKNTEHKAAVRALAWNPHQYGILLSGGGSRDQTIKVWNVNTNSLQNSVDVGSQVCKLQFSPDQNEFVCAHGFENNKITLWKYPTLSQMAELEGHQNRVLFMSLSPDAQCIVSGAGDETLKFWKVFQGKPVLQQSSLLKHSDLR